MSNKSSLHDIALVRADGYENGSVDSDADFDEFMDQDALTVDAFIAKKAKQLKTDKDDIEAIESAFDIERGTPIFDAYVESYCSGLKHRLDDALRVDADS